MYFIEIESSAKFEWNQCIPSKVIERKRKCDDNTDGHDPYVSAMLRRRHKKFLLQNQESFEAESWCIALGTRKVYQFVQMMVVVDLFLQQGQICALIPVWGKHWSHFLKIY